MYSTLETIEPFPQGEIIVVITIWINKEKVKEGIDIIGKSDSGKRNQLTKATLALVKYVQTGICNAISELEHGTQQASGEFAFRD